MKRLKLIELATKQNDINYTIYFEIYESHVDWEMFDTLSEGLYKDLKGRFDLDGKEIINYDGDAPTYIENEVSKLGYIIN